MSDAVLTEVRGHVGVVTFNRPDKRNPMSLEMIDALPPALDALASSAEVRAIVVTGAGRSFSAGADFSAMAGLVARTGASGPAATRQAVRALYDAFVAIDRVEVPTVAAVNGAAVGGGLGIALLCDIRIVAADAKLGANFSRLGIHPGLGITKRLPAAVGYERAAELLFTGRLVTGEEAVRVGLALEAVPTEAVLPRAVALAEEIAAAAPLAVRRIKRTLRAAAGREFDDVLESEAFAQTLLAQTEDAGEGIAAMMAKRSPKFEGR